MAAFVECAEKDRQRGVVLRVKRKRTDDPVEALGKACISYTISPKDYYMKCSIFVGFYFFAVNILTFSIKFYDRIIQ